jgi:uncharacterized protein
VVAGHRHDGNVLVHLQGAQACDGISLEALNPLLQTEEPPELILFGTGAQMQMLSKDIKTALENHGIAYDTMDTGAACRTFNILLQEERRVAAVLNAV